MHLGDFFTTPIQCVEPKSLAVGVVVPIAAVRGPEDAFLTGLTLDLLHAQNDTARQPRR